jgi:hypothetical protein
MSKVWLWVNAAKIGGSNEALTCGNSSLRDSKLSGIGLWVLGIIG